MTPNYSDGKWHLWDGSKCPVHPKSIVEAVWHDPRGTAGITNPRPAVEENSPTLAWSHVVKFRVVTEHKEPQVWAFNPSKHFIWFDSHDGMVHVREVSE